MPLETSYSSGVDPPRRQGKDLWSRTVPDPDAQCARGDWPRLVQFSTVMPSRTADPQVPKPIMGQIRSHRNEVPTTDAPGIQRGFRTFPRIRISTRAKPSTSPGCGKAS